MFCSYDAGFLTILYLGLVFIHFCSLCCVRDCISNHSLGFRVLGIQGRDRLVSELEVWKPWVLREVGSDCFGLS